MRYHADDEDDEAQWIAGEMDRLHDDGRYRWGDFAVFYRTNAQSRVLEEQLVRVGIPYKVIGGTRFYDRREVKDVLAYLRAVVNPIDEVSIKRVINAPKRGVGDSSISRLDVVGHAQGMSFIDALRRAAEAGVTGKAVKGIASFLALVDGLAERVAEGPGRPARGDPHGSGYLAELEAEHSIEAEGRIENLAELVGMAREFADDRRVPRAGQPGGRHRRPRPDDESSVVLMTLHSAKGLEYPVVFLDRPRGRRLPAPALARRTRQLEEERRLAYVGITRARERLYLSHAWSRTLFGGTQYNPPSRFLDEIPAELVARGARQPAVVASTRRIDPRLLRIRRRPGGYAGPTYGGRSGRGAHQRDWGTGGSGRDPGERRATVSSFDPDDDDRYARGRAGDAHRDRWSTRAGPRPPAPSGADQLGLQTGDDVRHGTFGDGVILSMRGSGDKTEAVVRFRDVGEKTLLLSWAPLEKL